MRTGGTALDHGFFRGIMSTATKTGRMERQPELSGQTVVVIGGSTGIGVELQEKLAPIVVYAFCAICEGALARRQIRWQYFLAQRQTVAARSTPAHDPPAP